MTIRRHHNASKPALSIIIPIYNVEAYLDECLASVHEQDFSDFEAILIDDGSTDGSSAIAQQWAERDPRFKVYRQENRGLGAARNAGYARSSGRYIAFLDSDDKVPSNAYRRMIETLEATGSDFVTGNVFRFAARGAWQSPGHRGVCDTTRLRTHVSRDRVLLRDLLAHNKLWRREFWEREKISFPEGVLYEDAPTTIPAHVKARSVDVLAEPVILYRIREDGIGSITQNRASDIRQLRDRISAVSSVNAFLRTYPDVSLRRDYDVNVLERDLRYFIDELPEADEGYRAEAFRLVNEFLTALAPETLAGVSVQNRIKYYLISGGKTKELLDYLELTRSGGVVHEPLRYQDGRLYLDLDFAADNEIPLAMLDATNFTDVVSRVSDIAVDADTLRITGWAYIDHLPIPHESAASIEVWLQGPHGRKVLPARLRRERNVAATVGANQAKNTYDWAGFVVEFSLRDLRRRGTWRSGKWFATVAVTVGDVRKIARLCQPTLGPAARPLSVPVSRSTNVRVYWDKDWNLVVHVERGTSVELTGCRPSAEGIAFDFKVPWLRTRASLLLRRDGAGTVKVPIHWNLRRGRIATALVRTDILRLGQGPDEERSWRVSYQELLRRMRLPIWVSNRLSPAGIHIDGNEVWARRNRYGRLTLLSRPSRARVIDAAWGDQATLRLLLDYPAHPESVGVVLAAHGRSEEWLVPVSRTSAGLEATLPLTHMSRFGVELPIRSGRWDLRLRTTEGEQPIELDLSVLERLPVVTSYRSREYRFGDERWHAACLRVSTDLMESEAGTFQQNRLRTEFYPAVRESEPLKPAVLYESYWGREFSDSPRELFDELRQRLPDWQHIVVNSDQQVAAPPAVTEVPLWSERYYKALAQCRLIVTNTHLPPFFERRDGQVVVQTWHGIGLKRVGLDIENLHMANRNYRKNLLREPRNWSYLISPNPFNTPILRRAFAYSGEILETGVPRNDIFYRVDRDILARNIRQRLGVDPDRKLVLYAPTWRDDQYYPNRKYKLDLQLDLQALAGQLGDGYQLLFRKHSNIVDKLPLSIREQVIDVSDFPDVQQILLVTDVLITDYSTLMFDYANTGRPMIFYTYDLERYRDTLRGFYFDFENEAPGPLIRQESDVVDAIVNADEIRKQFGDKYDAFTQRFCVWDDGGAAARVVDALMADLVE